MRWFSFDIFRNGQRFDSSAEFENAVNKTLTADTVVDATRKLYISEEGALNLSAVWACVRILSDTVGTLHIHLYKPTEQGRERQYTHSCYRLMQAPNSFSNRFDLMHHLIISCALWGNGYARIYWDKNSRPARLQFIHPARVEPVLTPSEELFYRLDLRKLIHNSDMIHLKGLSTNGIKGKSPIAVHRDNLSLTLAAQCLYPFAFGGRIQSQIAPLR
jgi:HK97 family phage portal protein